MAWLCLDHNLVMLLLCVTAPASVVCDGSLTHPVREVDEVVDETEDLSTDAPPR